MVVVALAGLPAAGSTTVGKLLAKQLNLSFFSVGEQEKKLAEEQLGFPETEAAEKYMAKADQKFQYKLDKLQRKIAKQGKVVVDGKLAIHILNDIADFKVWITCHKLTREKRVAERDKIDIEKAKQVLQKKEATEERVWKKVYDIDYREQAKNAEMIIDSTELPPQELVGQIVRRMPK